MKKRCKVIGLAAFAAYVVFRLLVCVKYTILTGSMMPTIQIEESVYVLKPLYGWRLYCFWSKSPDSFHRIHGIRDIVPGDIIVFNLPYIGYNIETIAFNPELEYCKRVLGTPGDRIGAREDAMRGARAIGPIMARMSAPAASKPFSKLLPGPKRHPRARSAAPIREKKSIR